jgi:hypothetical protein
LPCYQFVHMSDAKDAHAANSALQQFICYKSLGIDYTILGDLAFTSDDGIVGHRICSIQEDAIEFWGEQYPHPFGNVQAVPPKQETMTSLVQQICLKFGLVKIHRLKTKTVFSRSVGLHRLILGTEGSWDIVPGAIPNDPKTPLLDLLSHYDASSHVGWHGLVS